MPKVVSTLTVLVNGRIVGDLQELRGGKLRFIYDDEYDGPGISLSMYRGSDSWPVFDDLKIRAFLSGLLPDDATQRKAMLARRYDSSGRPIRPTDNPFRIVDSMGLDCPGAVQFCEPDRLEELALRAAIYRPISEARIGERLEKLRYADMKTLDELRSDERAWAEVRERWSLGGSQSKIALAYLNGRWHSCEGSAPTTHILKPGRPDVLHHSLNEAVCLRLANLSGVDASLADYRYFGEVGAIVVQRYDRLIDGDGTVTRLHQEDLCQALGIIAEDRKKYAAYGGPSARDILCLFDPFPNAEGNKLAFARLLFFNYLVGAVDAHARNYSVLLENDGPRLAPLYDCASVFAYVERPFGTEPVPIPIGGANKFNTVRSTEIRRFAETGGLDSEYCVEMVRQLAGVIPEHLEEAFDSSRGRDERIDAELDELSGPMIRMIRLHCKKTLERMW